MKIVSLGPDELSDWDLESMRTLSKKLPREIEEFVYWYKVDTWSGDGCAIYRDEMDMWHIIYLGHCSCYGPVEDLKAVPMSKEQVVKLLSDGKHYYHFDDEGEEQPYEEIIDYLKNTVKEGK